MMDRRRFLRNASILAAAVAVSNVLAGFATPDESDSDRLERLIKIGPVRGQSFFIDRPLPDVDYDLGDVVLVTTEPFAPLVQFSPNAHRQRLRGVLVDTGQMMAIFGGSLSGPERILMPVCAAYWQQRKSWYLAQMQQAHWEMPSDAWYGERGIYHRTIPIGSVNRERTFGSVLG